MDEDRGDIIIQKLLSENFAFPFSVCGRVIITLRSAKVL